MARAIKIILAVLLLLTAIGFSNTYLRRWATLQGPDVEDYKKLPTRVVANAPNSTPLPQAINSNWVSTTPFDFQGQRFDQSEKLDAFLDSHDTNAFIVLSGGKLVDARYYHGHKQDSLFKSFSMSKSVLSALFGIAQADGLISASDRLDKHLQNIKDPKLAGMKLQYLLDNVSGFDYQRGFAPWKQQPRMYYSANIRDYILASKFLAVPGTRFEGEDLSPLLIGAALESALRQQEPAMTLAEYTSSRLWQPMGAQYPAKWVLDRDQDGLEKVESGLVASAIDLARFGQLYLDNGMANGQQIVPSDWVVASVTAPAKASPNLFIEGFYRNLWWGSFRPNRIRDDFYANGHFGQRIYVSPDKNIVIVRLGSNTADVDWTRLLGTIADVWEKP
jgi:CubicO group peptidase (beta-lactamase class C family)